jgi:hypothetical protein
MNTDNKRCSLSFPVVFSTSYQEGRSLRLGTTKMFCLKLPNARDPFPIIGFITFRGSRHKPMIRYLINDILAAVPQVLMQDDAIMVQR